ncbi:ribose 5-phosphate isomerase [Sistotremastrum niveocremeum HHB9708]|uniref:Ribose-5-phosphate isomerase n=1 Tax=Sistotremastrum niveocremeum HHB9708 TaxID=1314777 RepID=A0A164MVD6_9AGAM|nr:ribose 5-phosphate isomerase [Sistotremastrum niveocremeum HHB9708]
MATLSSNIVDPAPLSGIEGAKRLAAWTAVDRHIKPEHKIIGIGSGSTVPYVVERIVAQGKEVNKDRVFLPTGFQSKELIVKGGLTLADIDQYTELDVTIDGADEVDPELNCIKGGGACQLREKVLAEAAETFIVVADYRKNSHLLGTAWKQGVPIEVSPFAYAPLLNALLSPNKLGAKSAKLRMSPSGGKAGPVVTDNGNFVIDAVFSESEYKNPKEILVKLKLVTGVVEVGLFCGMAKVAYFGNEDGSVTALFASGRTELIGKSEEILPAKAQEN